MKTITLNKKPLVEAIFEVRWDLTTSPTGIPQDAQYDVIVGQLKESLSKELPFHVRLPFGFMAGFNLPHQVQHQFRAAVDAWPLVQVGPGIMTVNETSGYTSKNFIPLCINVFNTLISFWKQNGQIPNVSFVSLRYIDADNLTEDKLSFLNKLGLNITFEKNIFNSKRFESPNPKFVEFRSEFSTTEPTGTFSLSVNTGKKDDKDAILWETQMICQQDQCKVFMDNPTLWLSNAHDVCHEVFFSMIQGELEEKYK